MLSRGHVFFLISCCLRAERSWALLFELHLHHPGWCRSAESRSCDSGLLVKSRCSALEWHQAHSLSSVVIIIVFNQWTCFTQTQWVLIAIPLSLRQIRIEEIFWDEERFKEKLEIVKKGRLTEASLACTTRKRIWKKRRWNDVLHCSFVHFYDNSYII